jgi:hypothetical protein
MNETLEKLYNLLHGILSYFIQEHTWFFRLFFKCPWFHGRRSKSVSYSAMPPPLKAAFNVKLQWFDDKMLAIVGKIVAETLSRQPACMVYF